MKQAAVSLFVIVIAICVGAAQKRVSGDPPSADQASAVESAEAPQAEQTTPLDELAWMVGKWIDAEKDSTFSSRCWWTQDHKFLTQSFSVSVDGKVCLEGEQKIGWDPIEKRIRSWIFDSKGGFGDGRWIKDGDRWEVKTSFVLAGGERASAVNVYTIVDADTYRWQSIDREIGGEMQPNIPEVTVVRQKADANDSEQGKKEALK